MLFFLGLDSVILPYIKYFVDTDVNGQKLLDMQPNDLDKIGVLKIGHQELILEAVDLLRNFVSLCKLGSNVLNFIAGII